MHRQLREADASEGQAIQAGASWKGARSCLVCRESFCVLLGAPVQNNPTSSPAVAGSSKIYVGNKKH